MKIKVFSHTQKALALIALTATMSACTSTSAPTAVQGNAYGVPVMYRTIPERISDEAIERTSYANLQNIAGVSESNVRIAIDSFRREVLLTGEVPNESVRTAVTNMVASINDVKKVYDYLTINSTPKSQSHTVHENYLKSKIIAKVVYGRFVKSSQYKLVVREDKAYLMGYLTEAQQSGIIDAISSVQGIEEVKTLNTIVSGGDITVDESIQDPQAVTDGLVYGGQSNTAPTYTASTANTATQTATTPMPTSSSSTRTPVPEADLPIVKLDGQPQSSYVDLYNGTSMP